MRSYTVLDSEECEYRDIEWYAVDREGNIAVFCSAGTGRMPASVITNAKNTDAVCRYFQELRQISDVIYIQPETHTAKEFSGKGLYYFDAYNGKEFCTYYTKHSVPAEPLRYDQLPMEIQAMLADCQLEIESFRSAEEIHIGELS